MPSVSNLSAQQSPESLATNVVAPNFKAAPRIRIARFSPDGATVAFSVKIAGRFNVVLIDWESRVQRQLTNYLDIDVADLQWVNNKRLLLLMGDLPVDPVKVKAKVGQIKFATVAINIDGSHYKLLEDSANHKQLRQMRVVGRVDDTSDNIIIEHRERAKESLDISLWNTQNGRLTLLTFDRPCDVSKWVLDRQYVPRIAVCNPAANTEVRIMYRATAESKWETLAESKTIVIAWVPMAFDADNQTLFVASHDGNANEASNSKLALYKYDIGKRKLGELVFAHPSFSVDDVLLVSRSAKRLTGVYIRSTQKIEWIDADLSAIQKQIDIALADTNNMLLPGLDNEDRLVLLGKGKSDSTKPYFFDRQKRKLIEIVINN